MPIRVTQPPRLDISASIATMTANPARLLAEHTGQSWWTRDVGHLGRGARADVTIIDWKHVGLGPRTPRSRRRRS